MERLFATLSVLFDLFSHCRAHFSQSNIHLFSSHTADTSEHRHNIYIYFITDGRCHCVYVCDVYWLGTKGQAQKQNKHLPSHLIASHYHHMSVCVECGLGNRLDFHDVRTDFDWHKQTSLNRPPLYYHKQRNNQKSPIFEAISPEIDPMN